MRYLTLSVIVLAVALGGVVASDPAPPKEPARIDISVEPRPVAPGQAARVRIQLQPVEGVKINRYPKIKLEIPAQEGLVTSDVRAELGSDQPPAPEQLESGKNYFKTVDPLELELGVDTGATSGKHEVDAKLTYFYCVTKSGFCAPARIPLKIPVAVR